MLAHQFHGSSIIVKRNPRAHRLVHLSHLDTPQKFRPGTNRALAFGTIHGQPLPVPPSTPLRKLYLPDLTKGIHKPACCRMNSTQSQSSYKKFWCSVRLPPAESHVLSAGSWFGVDVLKLRYRCADSELLLTL